MGLLNTMQNRRSVRKYNTQPVTDEELNEVLSAALLAPNGKGLRPWEFVVIKNKDTLKELVNSRKGGAKMLETANVAVAVYSGLGSVWLQLRLRPSNQDGVSSEEFVNARLKAPANMKLEALLVLGHIDEQPEAQKLPSFPCDKVHSEQW